MTKNEFRDFSRTTLLLDGATGSNLTIAGMPKGVCTETWILDHPDIFINLQKSYIDAGSQIIYAPTFAANRISMKNFNLENEIAQINKSLVALSKEAAKGSSVKIVGDVTTCGKFLEPYGELTYAELYDAYVEQITALYEAGVDILCAETMLSADEVCVFLDAAASVCDLPVMCTLTVASDGSAIYGGNVADAIVTLQELGADAVGINCSAGPDQLESVIRSIAKKATVPVIAKPNAGIPTITDTGEAIYSMDAKTFATHMLALKEAGASILGGCCGTNPEYIRLLHNSL